MRLIIDWETVIQARRREKPGCCGFTKDDAKLASFQLIVEMLKDHFSIYKCTRCLAVNKISCKTGKIDDETDITCLCDLWRHDEHFKAKPFNSISWIKTSPEYPGARLGRASSLGVHFRTLYTKDHVMLTFRGLKPGDERLKICDIISNPMQQKCYQDVSADSIQSYDKEFWMSTMQYQIAWKEVNKGGRSGETPD